MMNRKNVIKIGVTVSSDFEGTLDGEYITEDKRG